MMLAYEKNSVQENIFYYKMFYSVVINQTEYFYLKD